MCNVGDGARTSGGAPLVPFRVVVTLSETEVLQSVLRVLGFKVWDGLRQNLEFRWFLENFFFVNSMQFKVFS